MSASQYKDRIVTSGTGASDHIFLLEKQNGLPWHLFLSSGTWGDADLQASGDGVAWGDAETSPGNVANFTANGSCVVPGNSYYRLNVTTHSAAITLLAK